MNCLYVTTVKRGIIALLLLLLPGLTVALAQQGGKSETIQQFPARGLVVDDFGNPVKGVLVIAEGDTVAISDDDGNFDLIKPYAESLSLAHASFYVKVIDLNKVNFVPFQEGDSVGVKNFFIVNLSRNLLESSERIDLVYGSTNRSENVGAVSTINTDQLTTTLAPSIAYGLQGRVPGLFLTQFRGFRNPRTDNNYVSDLAGSIPRNFLGAPSDNTQFFVSLRGQSPVVIIDGVQRDIYSIDPENIESVSVVKDAFSTILLGMRSSRGALVITTKRPNAEGFKLSFTGQVGIQTPLKLPKPLPAYQYAYLLNEALQNDGRAPVYTYEDFAAFRDGSDPVGHPDVNWYNTLLENSAPISSYNMTISGGSGIARYSVSAGYLNQQGLFKTSDINPYQTNAELQRYLINSSVVVDVSKDFTVDLSLFARVEDGVQPGVGMNNLLNNIFSTPGNAYPIRNPNGSYGGTVSFPVNLYAQTINSGYISDNSRDIMADVGLHYDLGRAVKGLSANVITNVSTQTVSATIRNKQSTVFQFDPGQDGAEPSYTQYGASVPQANGFASVSSARFWYSQLSLDYERSFGRHNIEGQLFADRRVVTVNYDLPQKPSNLAVKASYDFGGRYFANAAFVRSYYNGYASGRQWGSFYAFGAGWDIAKEAFLSNASWLNQLKLRGVYGRTGNGIDNSGYYIFRQTYSQTFTSGTYDQGFGRSGGTGMTENAPLANPNITWEKANKVSAGVDVAMMNNRLLFTGDYFHDNYYDLLQSRGKSIALIGFSYPSENIGKHLYKGIELSLTYQNNLGNFNYFLTGNWSQMETEIVFQDEQEMPYAHNMKTGQPVNHIYGYVADGFFASADEIATAAKLEGVGVQPGDIRYKDLNNDGVINQFDQTVIGNKKPLSFYGITGGINYKGIDVSVLVQGAYNRDIYLMDRISDAGFQVINQSYGQAYEQVLGRWTPETAETATYPRLTAGNNTNNTQTSSFWVRSGDYLRVKNVSVGYTLPFNLSNRYNISAIKVFVNGQNLFTKSDLTYNDPEVTSFTSYPIMKVVSAGLNIKL